MPEFVIKTIPKDPNNPSNRTAKVAIETKEDKLVLSLNGRECATLVVEDFVFSGEVAGGYLKFWCPQIPKSLLDPDELTYNKVLVVDPPKNEGNY